MGKCCFIVGYREVFRLEVEERGICTESVAPLCECLRFGIGGMYFRHILFCMRERFSYIRGRYFGESVTVKHRGACGLFIKLENNSAERRFTTARFAYYTECFALVDIERDFLVCADIKLILLENA